MTTKKFSVARKKVGTEVEVFLPATHEPGLFSLGDMFFIGRARHGTAVAMYFDRTLFNDLKRRYGGGH